MVLDTWSTGVYQRAFIKLVEEVSEPLVRRDLKVANNSTFVDLITKKIRGEGRNVTAHFVVGDNDMLNYSFQKAMASPHEDLTHLFEKTY